MVWASWCNLHTLQSMLLVTFYTQTKRTITFVGKSKVDYTVASKDACADASKDFSKPACRLLDKMCTM